MTKKLLIILGGIIAISFTLVFMKPLASTITNLSQSSITVPVYKFDSNYYISGDDYNLGFVTNDNRIFTWGMASNGVLGNNTITPNVLVPTDISQHFTLNQGEIIIMISISRYMACFLTNQNRIFTWGSNDNGQIGNNTKGTDVLVPTDISQFYTLNEGENIKSIRANEYSGMFLTDQNRIFTWGDNSYLQLGNNNAGVTDVLVPTDISQFYTLNEGENIKYISGYEGLNMFLTDQNRIFTWGLATYGRLGNNTTAPSVLVPTDISQFYTLNEGENIIMLDSGLATGIFLTDQNRIFTWGKDQNHIMGNGSTSSDVLVPTDISQFYTLNEGENIVKISLSTFTGGFLTDQNRIFTWGLASVGKLGNNSTTTNALVPTDISQFYTLNEGENINFFDTKTQGIFVTNENRIFTWGTALTGALGNNTTTPDVLVPTDISQFYTLNEGEIIRENIFSHYETETVIIDTPFTRLLQTIPFILISAIVVTTTILVKKEGD